jgi:hypothetical protein
MHVYQLIWWRIFLKASLDVSPDPWALALQDNPKRVYGLVYETKEYERHV